MSTPTHRVTTTWALPELAVNLVGQLGTTTYADTNAARLSPLFHRVGVGN